MEPLTRTPEELRALRSAVGLDQAAAAERALVSRRTLQDWERGINIPQPAQLAWYLLALDAHPSLRVVARRVAKL